MFPDSAIAAKFTCGGKKMHLPVMLWYSTILPAAAYGYVLMFDEYANKATDQTD